MWVNHFTILQRVILSNTSNNSVFYSEVSDTEKSYMFLLFWKICFSSNRAHSFWKLITDFQPMWQYTFTSSKHKIRNSTIAVYNKYSFSKNKHIKYLYIKKIKLLIYLYVRSNLSINVNFTEKNKHLHSNWTAIKSVLLSICVMFYYIFYSVLFSIKYNFNIIYRYCHKKSYHPFLYTTYRNDR